ncbi:MAG: OmpA family protein [Bacteroidales bacterium]|nr:OmpA family protein [Bacteroidales bacterium]
MRSILTIVAFILLIFSMPQASAQNKKVDKALTYFNSGEYTKSRDMFIKIYPKTKDRATKGKIEFYLGECYRNLSDSRNSERWYRKAVQHKYNNPLATLYLAESMKMRGNYEDASAMYSSYIDLAPEDKRGEQGIKDCETALFWEKHPTRYIVYPARWLNDKESDFAPRYGSDSTEIYFTSARESSTGNEVNSNSNMYYTDVFYCKRDKKGKWSIPVAVEGGVNTPFDEGSPFVTSDGNTMFFTSCKNLKGQNLGCRIYISTLQDNVWSNPEEVVLFQDSAISVGHPCLSPDGKTLYFSSDAPNGFGGKDIWSSQRLTKNSWSEPSNMGGLVNSVGDDVYPFATPDGSLYFSSNGRGGLGGLDIFKYFTKDGETKTENMQMPINSSSDDFGISFFKNFQIGYFSSNREGSRSDDIYAFYLPPIEVNIEGVVKNEETTVVITDASVKLTGSDGTQLETKTDNAGVFKFKLSENLDYMFVSTKAGYLKGIGKETTKGLTENTTLHIEILMSPINQVIEIENIEYDFNKSNLREESKVSLDKLVELLNVNNNITIELRANTDFRGSDEDNQRLSQDRATSVVNYLVSKGINPLRLTAKGLGEANPVKVSKKIATKYPFLKEGDILSEEYINNLTSNQDREICHQLNRRTEFAVLTTDFKESGIPFGSEEDE